MLRQKLLKRRRLLKVQAQRSVLQGFVDMHAIGSDSSDTDDDEAPAQEPVRREPSFKLKLPLDSNLQRQPETQ
jgi:hypothetical protein